MDTNVALFWMTVAVCGSTAVRAARTRSRSNVSFVVIPVAVVLIALGVGLVRPGIDGFVAAGLCAVFVFLPPLSTRWAFRLATARRFRAARAVAKLAPLLHPNAAFRELPSFVATLERLAGGTVDELELRSSSRATPLGRFAYAELLRARGQWSELLAFTSALPLGIRSSEPTLAFLHLRALGELGRIEEMLAEYARLEALPAFATARDFLRLPIAARLGRVELVERLLAGRVAGSLNAPSAAYYRASTLQVAGKPGAAAALSALVQSPDAETRRAATRRLAVPLPVIDVSTLTPAARATLEQLEHEVDSAAGLDAGPKPARMTWLIVASLVVAFAFELPGGAEDLRNLVSLGALVIPPFAPYDDTWRILTAAWLHFGVLHLFMNVMGLVVIGRRVEAVLGPARLALLYAGSALLGNVAARVLLTRPLVLVGASGGVLGLLGVVLAITVRRRRVSKTRYLESALRETLVIVALQFALDWVIPGVSSTVHIAGFLSGFVLGLVVPQHANRLPDARTRGAPGRPV